MNLPKKTLEYISVNDLKFYERNTRTHSEEQVAQVAESIKEFGFTNPVLIDEDNVLIAGHGRTTAAKLLGLEEVPAIRLVGLSEAQRKALRIADNKLALNAGWDEELLKIELAELQYENFDMDLLGFSLDELENLLIDDSEDEEESEVVEDEIPEAPEDPKTKTGDVWILGKHRLICGDSTKAETFEQLMCGEVADITITSPPYGAGDSAKLREHYVKGKKKLESFYDKHDDKKDEWALLMRDFFAQCQSHSKCQFVNVQMLADNKRDLIDWWHDNAANFVDCVIWDKGFGAPQMQKNILTNVFEFVFVFNNENNSRTIPFGDFHGNHSNILRISRGQNEYSQIHKAVYPVELPMSILNIAQNAKSVIEPFCGTGTTLIACEQAGRKCFAVELSEKYCDVIINRWQQLTGLEAVREDGAKFNDL